ncbi:uncharacterized protein LOC141691128 [Apium graveolens]|uniref:uncharacterized protein LOC141691128 n=1 Tax=Apium graveolens TaxID=4045 RepID=UPI003D7B66B1
MNNHIEVRLDRALVSEEFLNLFKEAKLTNMKVSTPDHCPLLLETEVGIKANNKPSFHFENAWLREPMCYQLVVDAWSNNTMTLYDKLSFCSEVLSEWEKEVTGNFKDRISRSKRIFKALKGRRGCSFCETDPGGRKRSLQKHCAIKRVTSAQNELLLLEVGEKEVKAALSGVHPDKSSGQDGMTSGFYQKCWNIMKEDVVSMVQSFFESGSINAQLRVLANKLKKVMDSIMPDCQSAFTHGRLITENIMIAFKVMHYMKRKTKRKDSWMALKLDMFKAYDRVEWNFLEAVLLKMGFSNEVYPTQRFPHGKVAGVLQVDIATTITVQLKELSMKIDYLANYDVNQLTSVCELCAGSHAMEQCTIFSESA